MLEEHTKTSLKLENFIRAYLEHEKNQLFQLEAIETAPSHQIGYIMVYKDGEPFSGGIGCLLDAQTLITAWHVFSDIEKEEGEYQMFFFSDFEETEMKGDNYIEITEVQHVTGHDIGVARLETPKEGLVGYSLPFAPVPAVGSRLDVSTLYANQEKGMQISHTVQPNFLGLYSEFEVLGVKKAPDTNCVMSKTFMPGMSGSPVFYQGNLIGIFSKSVPLINIDQYTQMRYWYIDKYLFVPIFELEGDIRNVFHK